MTEGQTNPYLALRRMVEEFSTSPDWYPLGKGWHHQIKGEPTGVIVSVYRRGPRFWVVVPAPWKGGEFVSRKDTMEAAEHVALRKDEKDSPQAT